MIRLNLVLLLAVLVSAVYLVSVQYDSRRLFTELDRAKTEAHRLELENERLQVDKRAQTTPARVEKLAREKLQMSQAKPGITTYVTYSESPAAVEATASPRSASGASGVQP
jgi:cell division protein FtsL